MVIKNVKIRQNVKIKKLSVDIRHQEVVGRHQTSRSCRWTSDIKKLSLDIRHQEVVAGQDIRHQGVMSRIPNSEMKSKVKITIEPGGKPKHELERLSDRPTTSQTATRFYSQNKRQTRVSPQPIGSRVCQLFRQQKPVHA